MEYQIQLFNIKLYIDNSGDKVVDPDLSSLATTYRKIHFETHAPT